MKGILIIWFLGLSMGVIAQPVAAKKSLKLMGCGFEITAVANTDSLAWQAVKAGIAEIKRIEALISSWDKHSQTSQINRLAGQQPAKVDQELYDLVYRAKKISQLTQGAFDISFASMERIWNFNKEEQVLPDSITVRKAAAKIDWQKIVLEASDTSVFLQEQGMKIGFGGIGKGYAANKAKQLMATMPGVTGGIVNASGDLIAWGTNTESEPWNIQITDPKNKDKALGWLAFEEMAIVTSGDYEKYFTANGKRYAHIVNPKSGYPTTGITSVSIICPDAELADALATSVFVLGTEQGLALVNRLNQIECIIITDGGDVLTSTNLQLNYY